MAKSTDRKSDEYRNFEDLTKKLLQVPKTDLDKKMRRYEERKARRKKKSG
jgi:hypothetical protein